MLDINTKVVVVGAGPAGLAAAALLAHEGVACVLVGPEAPEDPRTMALMSPSIRLLERIGVWSGVLSGSCAPLRHLHIFDDTGNMIEAPELRFAASELGLEAFGYNVPLVQLVPALREVLAKGSAGRIVAKVARVDISEASIALVTDAGQTITAQAAIAADGARSMLREAAGIAAHNWSFDQDAMVANFDHSGPHNDTSTEWHRQGGVFTTVPLPGKRSSLVWLDKPAEIARLMALPLADLAKEIQLAGHGALGLISNVTQPRSFPMRGVSAERYGARRVFLVGEAAHVFPPVGAQGLNMSLRDIGHAVELIRDSADPGSPEVLENYDKRRRPDIEPRQLAISAVNHTLLAESVAPHALRALGLRVMSLVPPLRDYVMHEGLSPQSRLPEMMRR
jgi:2-octaprenyl-6-methoxyphenol hydroxylase